MLMNTTFLEDSFLIKWQSRDITQEVHTMIPKINGTQTLTAGVFSLKEKICLCHGRKELFAVLENRPDFATCFILTIEKNVENTALGLYFL